MALMLNARSPAAVREPTIDDLAKFKDLDDILTWSGLKGDFASITPDDY